MAEMKEIELRIPNLGEAEDTEIIELSVKPGDIVKTNDPLIVLESEKAAMEVPSDFDGEIVSLNVKEGESVKEGSVFAVIKVESKQNLDEKNEIEDKDHYEEIDHTEKTTETRSNIDFSGINAGPAVRKIAREMDIDLKSITGSGKNNLITKEDLKRFIHSSKSGDVQDFNDRDALIEFGEYEIVKQSKIRIFGAKNLQNSWQSIPHVTHFEEAEIDLAEKQRKELNEKIDTKITPLAYIVKSVCCALADNPIFNSSLVGEGEVFMRKYINIGIAVDTNDGLVVPVIHNADSLSTKEIAVKIIELSEKAKSKKLLQKHLSGATFTVSSLGSIGGTGFTPIINPPEVAILGVSRSKKVLSIVDEELSTKTILPLTTSYDHRVINGVDAGKFMLSLKNYLEKGI